MGPRNDSLLLNLDLSLAVWIPAMRLQKNISSSKKSGDFLHAEMTETLIEDDVLAALGLDPLPVLTVQVCAGAIP